MDHRLEISQFGIALAFRIINSFLSTAFFQPDEYYQSWEVAYLYVYGIGFRTWEWEAGLRTSLIPRIFGAILTLSSRLKVDHLLLEKLFMAFVAALGDLYTGALSNLIFPGTGGSAFVLSLFSMFNFYVSTRPFSNTFEMVITVVSLYYWIRSIELGRSINWKSMGFAMVLAHLSIALRPNGAIFWALIAVSSCLKISRWSTCVKFVLFGLFLTVVTQGAIMGLDIEYYYNSNGSVVIPMVQFAKFNFGYRISEIYGVLPWHWYISQGIPFLLLGYIPLFIAGWRRTPTQWKFVLLINLLVFSLISHKEFRFIYYLLPIMHAIASAGLPYIPRWLRQSACLLNLIVGLYFTRFHQNGVTEVVEHIHKNPNVRDVSFLMPCHSTPWLSHFGRKDDTSFQPQFLTCNPPWNITNPLGYIDQADQFYMNPKQYLDEHGNYLTTHVVVFEPLLKLMESYNYEIERSFFNGLFNEDARRQGKVFILKKN